MRHRPAHECELLICPKATCKDNRSASTQKFKSLVLTTHQCAGTNHIDHHSNASKVPHARRFPAQVQEVLRILGEPRGLLVWCRQVLQRLWGRRLNHEQRSPRNYACFREEFREQTRRITQQRQPSQYDSDPVGRVGDRGELREVKSFPKLCQRRER